MLGRPEREYPLGAGEMDIHKPKPWHGVREFLKEYAIIVVGVLTALAAEQGVEWLHWRHEVEAERRSLLAEAQEALDVVGVRQAEQACIDARLNQVHVLIQRHERHQPLKIIAPIGRHIRDYAALGSWQIALTGQALAHMRQDERLALSSAFTAYQMWNDLTVREGAAWAGLAPLREPDLLDDQDWNRLKAAYWDAEQININMQSYGTYVRKAQGLGLRPSAAVDGEVPGYAGATAAMCRPFVDLR